MSNDKQPDPPEGTDESTSSSSADVIGTPTTEGSSSAQQCPPEAASCKGSIRHAENGQGTTTLFRGNNRSNDDEHHESLQYKDQVRPFSNSQQHFPVDDPGTMWRGTTSSLTFTAAAAAFGQQQTEAVEANLVVQERTTIVAEAIPVTQNWWFKIAAAAAALMVVAASLIAVGMVLVLEPAAKPATAVSPISSCNAMCDDGIRCTVDMCDAAMVCSNTLPLDCVAGAYGSSVVEPESLVVGGGATAFIAFRGTSVPYALTLEFVNSDRPDGHGEISVIEDGYYKGVMLFPDDRTYALNYRLADDNIYWDGLLGETSNVWSRSNI